MEKKYKVRCCVFFGGTHDVKSDLTLEEAKIELSKHGEDVYTEFYITPNHVTKDYDYNDRIYK